MVTEKLRQLDTCQGEDKASLILGLTKRTVLSSAGYDYLMKVLHSDEDELVRFAAAVSLSYANPQRSSEAVIPIFLEAIKDAKPLVKAYKAVSVSGYNAVDEICVVLSIVGKDQASYIVPILLEALDKYRSYNSAMVAHALLVLVFKGDVNHDGIDFQQLSEGITFQQLNVEQQKVLRQIATSEKTWRYNMNMAETMDYFKLPTSREALMRFCGIG